MIVNTYKAQGKNRSLTRIGIIACLFWSLMSEIFAAETVQINFRDADIRSVIESAAEDKRGVTMAVHSSIGFIGSFLGPIGFGIVLNAFGGHNNSEAWFWAFSSTGIVLIIGPLLLLFLRNLNNKIP